MAIRQVDGRLFKAMVAEATRILEQNKEAVNALNVFPVPDGDTGSNMSLTMLSAAREAARAPDPQVGPVAQALAQGSLMGARGNSGVILSQLFRGFARHAGERATLDPKELARSFQEGVETAYKAVMKPVEGTILTVARESAAAATAATRLKGANIHSVLQAAYRAAEESLARTPELLIDQRGRYVLQEAGVVDSGGKGLTLIILGYLEAVRAAMGGELAEMPAEVGAVALPAAPLPDEPYKDNSPATQVAFRITEELSQIRFPYDTEFFIRGRGIPLDDVAQHLDRYGDSVYVVGTPDLAKVHIHTDNPGPVLTHCIQYGDLIRIEIHNMREQHEDLKARAHGVHAPAGAPADDLPPEPPPLAPDNLTAARAAAAAAPPSGVVAVAVGEGLEAIFKSMGAAATIQGGQTMNPSTQDLLDAINACPSPVVFVLPNNKNIILAAQQAAALTDKEVHVVPSRSIPQGLAALLEWNPEGDPEQMAAQMAAAMEQIQTGEITYAVRDTTFGDLAIKSGDMLGIWNGQIVTTGKDPESTLKAVLDQMVAQSGGEIVTIYYGEEVDSGRADTLAAELRACYRQHEIEIHAGGQPLYYYVFSLE